MREEQSAALEVALAYHRAWTGGDLEAALVHVAPDVRCETPGGPVVGIEAFRGFMGPFAASLRSSRLLASYGEGDTAMVMYDTETAVVDSAPGAELVKVVDGRIATMRIVFDRLPFAQARG